MWEVAGYLDRVVKSGLFKEVAFDLEMWMKRLKRISKDRSFQAGGTVSDWREQETESRPLGIQQSEWGDRWLVMPSERGQSIRSGC